MDKNNLVELTNKVYKLTLLFPKKEPLRYKIREVADDILACNSSSKKLQENLGILKKYFEVAKWQNWVSYFDILEIQQEYAKIRDILLREMAGVEAQENLDFNFFIRREETIETIPGTIIKELAGETGAKKKKAARLDSRKEKILNILEKVGRIQVGEINKLFPDVSKRTLRRDFHKLVEQGIVERIGTKNDTFYQTKTQNIPVGQ